MVQDLKNYIFDLDYRITILKNKINIFNYQKILTLNSKEIVLLIDNNKLVIKGNNLVLKKMIDNELLLLGSITYLEVKKDE